MYIDQHIMLIATLGGTIAIAVIAIVAIFLESLPIAERLLVAAGPVAIITTLLLVLVGASLERETLITPNVK